MQFYYFDLIFYLFIFILGLSLGSFLNSWIWRAWENIRIVAGRSMCTHCHRQLTWYENIPVLSYTCLKGKCRTCKKEISARYILVELGMAIILTFIYFYHNNFIEFNPIHFLRDVFFVTFLFIIFTYDAMYKIILSGVVWMGAVVGFFFNYFYLGFGIGDMAVGALIGGGFFLLQFLVSRGKWIGGGDVRLGFMMGIWLGWQGVLVALMFSYVVGAVFSLMMLVLKKKTWVSEIPFGTFLAVGTFFTMYWGNDLIRWYIGLLN